MPDILLTGLVGGGSGVLYNTDTGAIGGADADDGVTRTAESVIPDTVNYSLDPLKEFVEAWPSGFDNAAALLSVTAAQNTFNLQIGENAGDLFSVGISAVSVSTLGLTDIDVTTDASAVIGKVDTALAYVNTNRGKIGAANNRLESILAINATNIEATSNARSRIVDADYAYETGELFRRQVLLQAGQIMLAQANVSPRQVLSLLTG